MPFRRGGELRSLQLFRRLIKYMKFLPLSSVLFVLSSAPRSTGVGLVFALALKDLEISRKPQLMLFSSCFFLGLTLADAAENDGKPLNSTKTVIAVSVEAVAAGSSVAISEEAFRGTKKARKFVPKPPKKEEIFS